MDCFMIARGKRRALRKTCPHEWGHGSLEGYATGERSAAYAAAKRRGAASGVCRGQAEASGQRRMPRPGGGERSAPHAAARRRGAVLSLIHISEPTRQAE